MFENKNKNQQAQSKMSNETQSDHPHVNEGTVQLPEGLRLIGESVYVDTKSRSLIGKLDDFLLDSFRKS